MNGPFRFGAADDAGPARSLFVPAGLSDKAALIKHYRNALPLPGHVQDNWDSFEEALRDLSFIKGAILLIEHDDLPLEGEERQGYLQILDGAIAAAAKREGNPWLEVFFPEESKKEVEDLMLAKAS